MGFKFKVAVRDSVFEGKGLFALEFIPAGKVISTFVPEENDIPVEGHSLERITSFSQEELSQLEATAPERIPEIMHYGYYHVGTDTFIFDESPRRFSNHSNNPNYAHVEHPEYKCEYFRSLRDIQPGEELLEKYWGTNEYSKIEWVYDLFLRYEPSRVKTMKLVQS